MDEEWLRKYGTDAPFSVRYCYLERVVDDEHVGQLSIPTHSSKGYDRRSREPLLAREESKMRYKIDLQLYCVELECIKKEKPDQNFYINFATKNLSYFTFSFIKSIYRGDLEAR